MDVMTLKEAVANLSYQQVALIKDSVWSDPLVVTSVLLGVVVAFILGVFYGWLYTHPNNKSVSQIVWADFKNDLRKQFAKNEKKREKE
jgi:hypothetical protein